MAISSSGTPIQSKQELRERFLEMRSHVEQEEARQAAEACKKHFLKAIAVTKDKLIAGYYPLGSEINVLPIMDTVRERGAITLLPTIAERNKPLVFRQWLPEHKLVINRYYRIYEPDKHATEHGPDIVIVPLVAFDRKGNRLGFGGGYYDRTLAILRQNNPDIIAVGVAYACQEAEILPVEDKDQSLNWIVTEKEAFQCYAHVR